MRSPILVTLASSSLYALAAARIGNYGAGLNMVPPSSTAKILPHVDVAVAAATTGVAYFDTYLDHENKSAGTFPLKYYYNDQYYGGPGSPVRLQYCLLRVPRSLSSSACARL